MAKGKKEPLKKQEPEQPLKKEPPKSKEPSADPATYYDGYYTDNSDGVSYIIKTNLNGTKKWIKYEKPPSSPSSLSSSPSSSEEEEEEAEAEEINEKMKKIFVKDKPTINLVEEHTKKNNKLSNEPPKKIETKRALTSYNIFMSIKLRELRKKHPDLPSTDYMKMAGVIWQKLSDTEKKSYKLNNDKATSAAAA